jgi:hypothetical protein
MTDEELKSLFEALRQDGVALRRENVAMREENAAAHEETRRQFAEVADRIATENRHFFAVGAEGLRHEIQLVAEGVTWTQEALTREAADIRDEVRRTATETQAMIKFSHSELDRRISTLEQTQNRLEDALTDLQARVERLEGSTH